MCNFCSEFNFNLVGIKEDPFFEAPSVYLAGGVTKIPLEERFRFCPVCGRSLQAAPIIYAVEYRRYNAERDEWISKISQTAYDTLARAQRFIESRAGNPSRQTNYYYQTEHFEEYYIHEVTVERSPE